MNHYFSKLYMFSVLSGVLHHMLALFSTISSQLLLLKCTYRNSPPEVLLEKYVLKICSKFTGEHPCLSAISITL